MLPQSCSTYQSFEPSAPLHSQWDDEERVDLLAVEDDKPLDETVGGAADVDAVEVAAGGEKAGAAVVHYPRDEKVGAGFGHLAVERQDAGRADQVPIAVRLEDEDAAQGCHPVHQHAT